MGGQIKNLTGMSFDKLVVVSFAYVDVLGAHWICKCDCGNIKIACAHSLKTKHTRSCGCLLFIAGGMDHEPLYKKWRDIKVRCYNPKHKSYRNYGGRGIKICDEWKSNYLNFRKWALNNGYDPSLTLDRTDNNKGYSPENCRFTTWKEQENNRRNNHVVTHNNISHTISEWADLLGVSYSTVETRVKRGWSFERIITTPQQKRVTKNKVML